MSRVIVIENKAREINHDIVKTYIQDEIVKNLRDLESTFHTGQKLYYNGWDNETQRQLWLKDIIKGSNSYVKAVTSYDPDYWQNFWGRPSFSHDYMQVNIAAAERGVNIKRIFILSDDILKGNDITLCNRVKSFVKPMLNRSANLENLFVSSDQIPDFHSNYRTSNFLISDDIFVGFSEKFSEEKESSGYISILDTKEIQKCNTIYSILLRYAEPASIFPFMQGAL